MKAGTALSKPSWAKSSASTNASTANRIVFADVVVHAVEQQKSLRPVLVHHVARHRSHRLPPTATERSWQFSSRLSAVPPNVENRDHVARPEKISRIGCFDDHSQTTCLRSGGIPPIHELWTSKRRHLALASDDIRSLNSTGRTVFKDEGQATPDDPKNVPDLRATSWPTVRFFQLSVLLSKGSKADTPGHSMIFDTASERWRPRLRLMRRLTPAGRRYQPLGRCPPGSERGATGG